ncbi:hypothetical protein [Halorubrum sp. DTA46]|uniref:hypothetical protein n=1 Tax=Halorubrum sp. DTA46 TaxID=3402162 RepID=UPI003AAABBF7
MTEEKLWTHKTANEITTRELVGERTTLVIFPDDAFVTSGQNYMLIKIPYTDGDGDEQSLSAFDSSCPDDVWDELLDLVKYWDRRRGDRVIAITDAVATIDGEYLNINPTQGSKIHVGKGVGGKLIDWGYVEP